MAQISLNSSRSSSGPASYLHQDSEKELFRWWNISEADLILLGFGDINVQTEFMSVKVIFLDRQLSAINTTYILKVLLLWHLVASLIILKCLRACSVASDSLDNPVDCSPSGSSVHAISQARNWTGLPFCSPGDFPSPGIEPASPAWQADSLPLSHQGSPMHLTRLHFNNRGLWSVGQTRICFSFPFPFDSLHYLCAVLESPWVYTPGAGSTSHLLECSWAVRLSSATVLSAAGKIGILTGLGIAKTDVVILHIWSTEAGCGKE